MPAKIINFQTGKITDTSSIINFEEAAKKARASNIINLEEFLNRQLLDELPKTLFDEDTERCRNYHETAKGFRRELRKGNPDCACHVCEGYDVNCLGYELKNNC